MKRKRIIALFLSIGMLLTSGCWDMVEIERRALIGAMLIDLIEKDEENENKSNTSPFCEDIPNTIRVIFGINNPSKLMEGGQGAAVTRTVEAANIPDAMEELGSRTSRMPFYGQVRLLIFTDRLVKNEKIFRETLDEFERKAIINQQMKIVVLVGKEEDFFKVEPKLENIQSLYVTGIMDNSKVLSNTENINLGELNTNLRNNDGSAAIPVLEVQEKPESAYLINKVALIKDYKLLTILDSKYMKTYKMVKGELDNGRKLVAYKGITVPFYAFSSKRRIWLEEGEEGLKFRVKVELEGDIEQFEFNKELFDPKVIADVKKTIEDFTVRELEATTEYFQKDIGHDFLGFNEYTNKYHYKIFKKYENNWDEAFKNAEIVYEVEADVRRIGTSK
jgi:Ger(x)C family germination protein